MSEPTERGRGRRRVLVRRCVGVVVLLVGLLDMAAVLRPGLYHRLAFLADVLPGAVVSASAGLSVVVGMLLALLAVSLGRGRRRAWRIVVALLAFETVLQSTQGHHVLALASLALTVLLVLVRDDFRAASAPIARSGALRVGGVLLALSFVLGFVAVSVLAGRDGLGLTAGERLVATAQGLVGITSEVTAPDDRDADAVYYLLVAMMATTVLTSVFLLLRAPRWLPSRSDDEQDRLERLVADADDDSLAYFALRDDRSVVWSPNGRACVSYRQVGGTLLAGGDPIGPPAEWPAAVRAFVELADAISAVPAVAAASEPGAQAWARHGRLAALEFGDEAVLSADGFTLDGRDKRNVRQAAARAARAGVEVSVRRLGGVDALEVESLRTLSDAWRGTPDERGFSMALGRVDAVRDPDAVLVVAAVDDVPQALLLLVPWGRHGLSLDLMRRDAHAPSGVNERMIVTLLEEAPALGADRVSLNFAPFREAIERSERFGAGPGTRLWGRLLRLAARGSQADALYRFNAKFRPEWHRRFLLHPPAVGLPRVTWAYLRAEGMVPSLRLPAALPRPGRRGDHDPRDGAAPPALPAQRASTSGLAAHGSTDTRGTR